MPLLPKEQDILPETIFELTDPWRVAHVRSRQEKVLARHLAARKVAFFRGDAAARQTALRSNVVASLIEVENQPLLNEELRQIRRLQLAGASLVPIEELMAGGAVPITEGAFAGYHGTVVRGRRAARLLVSVSLLRQAVAVEFPQQRLRRLRL